MSILALDLGRSVGWARCNDQGGLVGSGVLVLPGSGEGRPAQLAAFWSWLEARLEPHVTGIAYESPLARISSWAQTLPLALEALIHLASVGPGRPLALRSVAPNTLKKHATGDGRAKKHAMIAAACRRWSMTPKMRDHEADALCVLAWALSLHAVPVPSAPSH